MRENHVTLLPHISPVRHPALKQEVLIQNIYRILELINLQIILRLQMDCVLNYQYSYFHQNRLYIYLLFHILFQFFIFKTIY